MKSFFFAVTLAALAVSTNAGVAVREEHPIDWYDCSGSDDGNYYHPSDCTRFISCSGGIASQRDCPDCHVDARRCPEGRLVYNASVDACLWADETTCQTGPSPTTTTRVTEVTTRDSDISTSTSTTEAPLPDDGDNDSDLPDEGRPCNPRNCTNKGFCHYYLKCNNETGVWEKKYCGNDLLWDPYNSNGTDHIHGGNCNTFENLHQKEKDRLKESDKCLRCFWREIGKCNVSYKYQKEGRKYRNVETLTCPSGLVFVGEMETCQRCYTAKQQDGVTPCCSRSVEDADE